MNDLYHRAPPRLKPTLKSPTGSSVFGLALPWPFLCLPRIPLPSHSEFHLDTLYEQAGLQV